MTLINARTLPAEIERKLAGARIQPVTIGRSGNEVFRLVRDSGPTYYLKSASRPNDPVLTAEKDRLEWLDGRLPVAAVEAYASIATHTYLLLSEVPGLMACEPELARSMPALVRALAEGMRLLHSVDTGDCPFDQRVDGQLEVARRHLDEGLVDAGDFDEVRKGARPADLLAFLQAHRPAEEVVFTHGDYCLPNILINPATMRVSGFVDMHIAGTADRYQDIALATRSLGYNRGQGWSGLLWAEYGLDKPDHDKIEYYQVLDEFF